MSQNFPQYADVPLRHAPLGEVICQVRFSPVFRIATDPPSELQEIILARFTEVRVGDDSDRLFFRFVSSGGETAFTVDPDSFSLSTKRYTIWDEFGRDLSFVQNAMQTVYRIPWYGRIGLRYVNLFTPENTGADTVAEISEVLRAELTMPLRIEPLARASEIATQLLLDEPGGRLILRVGSKAKPEEGGPLVFLDLDFFSEGRLPTDDLIDRCRRYHDVIYDAFRWSLNDEKLELFEPVKEGAHR